MLILGLFIILSCIATTLALSGCQNDYSNCYEIPVDFPEQMQKITYNGNIYAVDQVITFRTPPACRPYPPEVPKRWNIDIEAKVEPAGGTTGTLVEYEPKGQMYGFNPESVCKQFRSTTPDSSDFGDELGSYIGEASNTSDSYNAYYLEGVDENQAIAIEIELVIDSSIEIEDCPCYIFCYLKYVRQ